ncbi:MAG: sigma 54-interacting transcriptional regulator [Acidobacteria bacterium]|nr:sigma 54-interacting transcriptional regulator [Acidobacteriota bacterium]MBK8148753.1 sigma 54-interacting transcriptional regulator [Acidobacteriota bacterium]MBK8810200.1 sigma 54-interacting transcriptional regulator [Acidobacteriota bacterium]
MNAQKLKAISKEQSGLTLKTVEEKLTAGFSAHAEKMLLESLATFKHAPDDVANLKRLLSYTFETLGRYQEALDIVREYENEEILQGLALETQLRIVSQLAIGYSNTSDYPKAATLLKETLQKAKFANVRQVFGTLHNALSRVYRKLNEFSISAGYAAEALDNFREEGDWRGMAESYQLIATASYQEGNLEKSLENYGFAIKIIGERTAPFLLGRIYSDMSGVYWLLRRPQDGIACLEKSIKFFDQTDHRLNSVIAYNNLGMNLMLIGDWARAEQMMLSALEIAKAANHVHVAGILDSIGELKMLRGKLDEAEQLLNESIEFALERKREWYSIQSMRNLGRCYLAQGKPNDALDVSKKAIEICRATGERHILNTIRLVLAEAYLDLGEVADCETEIKAIEDSDPSSDFYVLGSIQRIRGFAALEESDEETAVYHFSRALTIFEAAEDIYHVAITRYALGKTLFESDPQTALRHLISASEVFRKLEIEGLFQSAEKLISKIKSSDEPVRKPVASAGSQLVMLRLAEATASRELLFRELVAVLKQEGKARKVIVAESGEGRLYFPFITQEFSNPEAHELVEKLNQAIAKNEVDQFSKSKNIAVLELRAPSAPPAMLLIYPRSGAVLRDGGPVHPLLRVVSLGMDVCALRDKDRHHQIEPEPSPYVSNSLLPGFIHSSPAMTSLVEEVYKIRSSDVTVLVTGESGTGKELVSRAIHAISNRKDRVFIPFNCTAVPKELAEGHLFGYRKGAFTGAVNDSPGMIRAAHGGTLFLDEVGDLPLEVQPKLLRFLQEGEVQPIGEKTPIKVDVRVIAATNMVLEQKVANGTFREDLYYRLNVIRLRVPPLRERRSEIPPIISYYINHYSARFNKRNITITPQTIDVLMVCEWEGNVRQLCNEIQRVVARAADGDVITPDQLSQELKRNATPISPIEGQENVRMISNIGGLGGGYNVGKQGSTLEEAVAQLETQMIVDALRRHDWNISRVARELGLTRRGLYLKLARYGIEKAA